ncbi:hypothetical protein, partial [Bradyrhizobium sp.]|uniref:hypothetical protein n=1 Tax=Bradyrhizobium sp. TaxID=376 RepID=UPI003C757775
MSAMLEIARHAMVEKRAAPITDWHGYIRPHLRAYEELVPGKQGECIAKLSRKVGSSDNTLRRFIAAAQFLEAMGITELPTDRRRMPVAAVEAIARIGKRDPGRVRPLLAELAEGEHTIRDLKDELSQMPRGKSRSRSVSGKWAPSVDLATQALSDLREAAPGWGEQMTAVPLEDGT